MEITFRVEKCSDSGVLTASWDDAVSGGITTQGDNLPELLDMVKDAVACHFDEGEVPSSVKLHFTEDPLLQTA